MASAGYTVASRLSREAARSGKAARADLTPRAAHARDAFPGRKGPKGPRFDGRLPRKRKEGGLVEVSRREEVLERGHHLVSLRADDVLASRAVRWSTGDPAASGGMVSLGRGTVGGLAKGNARGINSPGWAEAFKPAIKSADLRGELGGTRAPICRRRTRGIASKRKQWHGQVESRRPVRADRR